MSAGAGDTITVLLAVTPVAVTVIDLLLQLAAAKVTVIVELHPLGAAHSYPLAVLVTTYPVVAVPHGENSLTVTAHVLPFTLDTGAVYVTAHVLQLKLVTHVELVKYPASLLKSDTSVGISELVIYPLGFVEL